MLPTNSRFALLQIMSTEVYEKTAVYLTIRRMAVDLLSAHFKLHSTKQGKT